MATKTPVSILMELCVKKNMKVHFVELSTSGPPNDPIFVMSATVTTLSSLTYVGEGTAKTKKDAKQNAAQAVLGKIEGALSPALRQALPVSSPVQVTPTVPVSAAVTSGFNPVTDLSVSENSVGRLLEFCAQNKYANPVFDYVSAEGQSHQPLFTMKASQGEEFATASARTKQQAKQDAARLLYEKLIKRHASGLLQAGPLSAVPISQMQPVQRMTEREVELVIEKYEECKPLSSVPKTNSTLKFGSFHSAMTDLLSRVKDDLNKTSFPKPKEALNALAEKLQLSVSYHEARDISDNNPRDEKLYVYAIVNTQPTTVQIGEGQSTQVAQGHAALTVLRYWQTFLGIFPVM